MENIKVLRRQELETREVMVGDQILVSLAEIGDFTATVFIRLKMLIIPFVIVTEQFAYCRNRQTVNPAFKLIGKCCQKNRVDPLLQIRLLITDGTARVHLSVDAELNKDELTKILSAIGL